jgi:hypothetical protein
MYHSHCMLSSAESLVMVPHIYYRADLADIGGLVSICIRLSKAVPHLDGDTELMSAWQFPNGISKIEWLILKERM